MLRLYGSANSRALRVVWMLHEIKLPFDHKDWLPRSAETRTAEYQSINPNARVPTIDDDGFILSESMAINLYLAKKHQSTLYPSDPQSEALVWQWCLWETDRLDRAIVNYVRHTVALPAAERKATIAASAWEEVLPALRILDGALHHSTWLVGKQFSVADLNVAGALYRALSIDTQEWPHLHQWLLRCWDRPAAKIARAQREQ